MNILDHIQQPERMSSRYARLSQMRDAADQRKLRQLQMQDAEADLAEQGRLRTQAANRRAADAAGVVPGRAAQLQAPTIDVANLGRGPVALPGGGMVERPEQAPVMAGGGQMDVNTPPSINRGAQLAKMTELDASQVPGLLGEFVAQDAAEQKRATEQQKMALELRKGLVGLNLDTLKLIAARGARVAQVLAPVLQAPEELQPQMYAEVVEMLEKNGDAQPGSITRQYPGAAALQFMVSQGRTLAEQSKLISSEKESKEKAHHNSVMEKERKRGNDLSARRLDGAEARRTKSEELASARFEETKRANAEREKLARESLEKAHALRLQGKRLEAIKMEMKAQSYLDAVEGQVGPMDNALGALGYETDDAAEAKRARGIVERVKGARGGAAPAPSPGPGGGAMETQTHPVSGEVFERRKGSNDPWRKRARQ